MGLKRFVLKRVLVTIPILIGVTILTFGMVQLIPGDPIDLITAFQDVSPETEQMLREQYGLDRPVYLQYFEWLYNAAQLDFGTSIVGDRPVTDEIMDRLPYTLLMGSMAFVISMTIAIPAGIIAAYYRKTVVDQVSRVLALVGVSLPNFWLGLLLILIFASWLGWFTVLPPTEEGLLSSSMIKYTLLPAITIGTGAAALLMRLMRSAMVEELDKDYVKMARAKGLPERTVIGKHVLRNSLISVVTVAALQVAFIISGSVVVEIVFSYPGIGRLLVTRAQAQDLPVIQALVLLIGVFIIAANLLADIVYAYLDPRIRY